MKIRIKFSKHGIMKFIGHLDIMRYFQKAMRRADVDIKYSEGFSPHQIMSFAAPLGVGITSNGEYLDIEVLSTKDSKTMTAALNEVMAKGIEVLSYKKLGDSAGNAMSLVAAADYTLTFRDGYAPENPAEFFSELLKFYEQESVMITKKTKKSQKEMDLKPLIYELTSDGKQLFMKISTGSTDNIKPELVLDAYYQSKEMARPEFAFQIQREEVYADLGSEGNHKFVPLEDLGEDIE